ncbi:MAG: AbiH family protein [Parabacteroides sp.]
MLLQQRFYIQKKEIIKVHGSIENKNIIFGVEDKANIKKEHIFLKKSYNINFTPIDISNYLEISDSIIFFGHSLGETDHTYFRDFFFLYKQIQQYFTERGIYILSW